MNAPIEPFAALDLALLNDWQRDFPLTERPFDTIGAQHGCCGAEVQTRYRALMHGGALSRIGGIFGVGAGGSAMLCALAVPESALSHVAQQVSAFDYVNHNYARQHHWNLWFVVTAPSAAERDACVDQIEHLIGLRALRLPMKRAFRIDLGFDLKTGQCQGAAHRRCQPIAPVDHPLAAAMEAGLPFVDRPYAQWADQSGRNENEVQARIQQWLNDGTLRRFGVVVRHHELGVAANAMTVFNVPDDDLQTHGPALAQQPGITLCYARQRDTGWPYNLYCMVHGRTESETRAHIAQARQAAGLTAFEHAILFSTQRFKQTGGKYFRASPATLMPPSLAEAA